MDDVTDLALANFGWLACGSRCTIWCAPLLMGYLFAEPFFLRDTPNVLLQKVETNAMTEQPKKSSSLQQQQTPSSLSVSSAGHSSRNKNRMPSWVSLEPDEIEEATEQQLRHNPSPHPLLHSQATRLPRQQQRHLTPTNKSSTIKRHRVATTPTTTSSSSSSSSSLTVTTATHCPLLSSSLMVHNDDNHPLASLSESIAAKRSTAARAACA